MAGWSREEKISGPGSSIITARAWPTSVMNDLKAIVGEKDYFVVTSNGEGHFELCGTNENLEIEGNWFTICVARHFPSLKWPKKIGCRCAY